MNKSIQYIQKLLKCLPILMLTLTITSITMFTRQPDELYATEDYSGWASSIVDSMGVGNQGGTTQIRNGVSYTQTGYLAYMLTSDGNTVPDTNAIALYSPGFSEYAGSGWYCTSRKGEYTADHWSGEATWELTPWQEGGTVTNEPAIKAWFQQIGSDGVQNAVKFIIDNWGTEIARSFGDGDLILVIETLMNLQYSVADGSSLDTALEAKLNEIRIKDNNSIMREALAYGLNGTYDLYWAYMEALQVSKAYEIADRCKDYLIEAIKREYDKRGLSGGGRAFVGDPVIGSVPNILDYANFLGTSTKVFDSYLRNVAPFAEMIEPDGAGKRAGFTPYTGSTAESVRLSDSEVKSHGVALLQGLQQQGNKSFEAPYRCYFFLLKILCTST